MPPSSMRAARCASSADMPWRMFSSISISRCERISWSRSASTRWEEKRLRKKLRALIKSGMRNSSLRSLQRLADGPRNAAPAFGFRFELLPPRLRQPVEFCAAIVFGVAPEGGDPAFLFHAMQRGKERAGFHVESAGGGKLDPARDSQTVHFASDEGLQDQQVQRSLQKGGGFRVQK